MDDHFTTVFGAIVHLSISQNSKLMYKLCVTLSNNYKTNVTKLIKKWNGNQSTKLIKTNKLLFVSSKKCIRFCVLGNFISSLVQQSEISSMLKQEQTKNLEHLRFKIKYQKTENNLSRKNF